MITGIFYWKASKVIDNRGSFMKVLTSEALIKIGGFKVQDYFITKSAANVIRGMHLQVADYKNNRIIFVNRGKVEDVLIDLRDLEDKTSPPRKNVMYLGPEEELDCAFVPAGVAHGFATIKEAEIIYLSDKTYSAEHDRGFNPLSFSHIWEIANPILSERDEDLPSLKDFVL
jgi:dTDP-4-dehydrorhamnose 3,5-epimerase